VKEWKSLPDEEGRAVRWKRSCKNLGRAAFLIPLMTSWWDGGEERMKPSEENLQGGCSRCEQELD
jgi:hypothetical protein